MNAFDNLQRVQRNVARMRDNGFPDDQIDEYLSSEGYDYDSFMQASTRAAALGGAKPADVGFGGRALNSAMFNFGDELAGLYRNSRMSELPGLAGAFGTTVDRMFGFDAPAKEGTTYAQEVAAARMGQDEYQRLYPGRAIAADLTGAIAPAIASGGSTLVGRGGAQALASAAAQTTARATPSAVSAGLRAAGVGGVTGAASGAGAGEDLRGRLTGAGSAGVLGAGFGGAFGASLQGFTNWMARRNIPAQAQRYFLNLINEEGRSVDDVMDEIIQRESIGVGDNLVADVMGPAFRSEMSGVANQSAELKEALTNTLNQRGRAQGQRIREAASAATGGRVQNTAREAANRLVQARAEADPLYAQFRSRQPFVNDPVLGELVAERPALVEGLNAAQKSLLNRGTRDASRVEPQDVVTGLTLGADNVLTPTMGREYLSTLTPTALDRLVKRTNVASDASNPVLTQTQRDVARDTMAARGDLLGRIDKLAPEYAQARQIYAGAKEYGDMARSGRQFLDADTEAAEALLRARPEASVAGQQAFGEGVLDALGQKIGASEGVAGRVNSAVNRVATPQYLDRLTEAFPQARGAPVNRFVQQLDALAQQTATRNQFLGGMTRRATGSRVNEDAALQATAGELSSGFFQGNALPFIAGAATRSARQGADDALMAERRAAGPMFSAVGRENIAPLLENVTRTRAIDTARDAALRTAPGRVGGGAAMPTMEATRASQAFDINRDTSVSPERENAARSIEKLNRWIADPNTPPEERARFEVQRNQLRLML